jgi:hypothetical protein
MSGLMISLQLLTPITKVTTNSCGPTVIEQNFEQGVVFEQWADDVFFCKEVENEPLFFRRRKIQKAYNNAIEHYQLACDCGNAKACHNIGWQYKYGKGVEADYDIAAQYFAMACEGGEPYGCSNLGYLYYVGRGFEQSDEQAKELFAKACEGGVEAACGFE